MVALFSDIDYKGKYRNSIIDFLFRYVIETRGARGRGDDDALEKIHFVLGNSFLEYLEYKKNKDAT